MATGSNVIHGDCLEKLKEIPTSSVDSLVTDPPYGYSFMGKDWDKAVVGVETWKECLRVLKPGAFAFVMSAPRQDVLSRMMVNLADAGFETAFTSIYWTYASGFPKAMNIGKMVDKRMGAEPTKLAPKPYTNDKAIQGDNYGSGDYERVQTFYTEATSPEAKALDGSYGGFQPKPAVEVILVAMKPLSEKTYVDQAMKNRKGVTWLDDARIPTAENLNGGAYAIQSEKEMEGRSTISLGVTGKEFHQPSGRFPANLLVSDDVLNDGKVRKSTGGSGPASKGYKGDGHTISGSCQATGGFGDSGSYSRFFSLDQWAEKTFPFLIVPKASKREKGKETKHPTVKPVKLMSYLVTLSSRPGDTVLDPFLGSGTTGVAAKMIKRNFIGIEREAEYVEIAKARISAIPDTLL